MAGSVEMFFILQIKYFKYQLNESQIRNEKMQMRNIQEDYFKYSNWRRRNFIILLIFPINFVSNGKIKLYKSCPNGNTKLWKIKFDIYLSRGSLADGIQVGENVTQYLRIQVVNVHVC